jgi:hypothetical protein
MEIKWEVVPMNMKYTYLPSGWLQIAFIWNLDKTLTQKGMQIADMHRHFLFFKMFFCIVGSSPIVRCKMTPSEMFVVILQYYSIDNVLL